MAVVALGLVFDTLARWLLYDEPNGGFGGWFNYAPQTGAAFPRIRRYSPGTTTIVSIVFIAAWAAVSIWLLRTRERDE